MNELSNKNMCLKVRGDIEIWLDEQRAENLKKVLLNNQSKFLEIDGKLINTYEIIGLFNALDIQEAQRKKNGEYKCRYNTWHDKNQKCDCREFKKLEESRL